MSEAHMPVTEAQVVEGDESSNYELAFHILPTVAEEEVVEVQNALREMITKAGGTIDTEESAARFDLAYDITKNIEGKRHTFSTAYFGWIRFTGMSDMVSELQESLDVQKELLRYMIIKLTKEEAARPFTVHKVQSKMPETVGDEVESEGVVIEAKTAAEDASEKVEEKELDDSLGKITQ